MNVVRTGLMGAVVGILGGFVLGMCIWALNYLLDLVIAMEPAKGVVRRWSVPEIQSLAMIGTSFGALIGSIFGSIAGLKEKK